MSTQASTRDLDIEIALLIIRVTTAAFLVVWALDKMIGPSPALKTFSTFYFSLQDRTTIQLIGAAQLGLVLAFAGGLFKTPVYAAVTLMHAVSTLASWPRYLDPLARPNILFFAAFPVLAALVALFILRRRDRLVLFGT